MSYKQGVVLSVAVTTTCLIGSICQASDQWLLPDRGTHLFTSQGVQQADPYWQRRADSLQINTADSSHVLTIEQIELIQPWDVANTEAVDTRSLWQSSLFDNSGAWHLAGGKAVNENHLQLGRTQGRLTLVALSGEGFGYSRLAHGYRNVSPYFFHGGTNTPFDFSGLLGDTRLTDSMSLQFGQVKLTHGALKPRHARILGLRHARGGVQFAEVDRGSERVLRGLNLSLQLGPTRWVYRGMQHINQAELHGLSINWSPNHRTSLSMDIEARRNPLYAQLDDQRLMFRVQHLFGGDISFYAQEKTGDQSEETPNRGRVAGIIGLGVVAAAAIGSSGNNDQDSAPRLQGQHAAGQEVLNGINPTSVRENREYGGWVYQNPDGSFSSTAPVRGEVASVNIGNPTTSVPPGTTATASYHTHGGPDPRFLNEQFSPQDLSADRFFNVDGYLSTPAAALLFHNVRTGPESVTQIGTVAN